MRFLMNEARYSESYNIGKLKRTKKQRYSDMPKLRKLQYKWSILIYLIVLGQTFRAAGSSGLDLSGAESDDQVGDEAVLGLAGTVRDHSAPA